MVQKVTHSDKARSWARTRVSLCGVEPRDDMGGLWLAGLASERWTSARWVTWQQLLLLLLAERSVLVGKRDNRYLFLVLSFKNYLNCSFHMSIISKLVEGNHDGLARKTALVSKLASCLALCAYSCCIVFEQAVHMPELLACCFFLLRLDVNVRHMSWNYFPIYILPVSFYWW